MKIAISSTGQDLDAQVSYLFGRCNNFVIIDSATMQYEAMPNAAQIARGGAGIQAAERLVRAGVQAVISGNVGPNAMQVLNAAQVPAYSVAGSSVRDALQALQDGKLQPLSAPTVASDFGKPAGMGGHGRGQGRG